MLKQDRSGVKSNVGGRNTYLGTCELKIGDVGARIRGTSRAAIR
jgi:hypothetical protein